MANDAVERAMKPIPIEAAKRIADEYGYDQVIVFARRVGEKPNSHGEHLTTYGVNKTHCGVAARVGNFLKTKVMGWHADDAGRDADPWNYIESDGLPTDSKRKWVSAQWQDGLEVVEIGHYQFAGNVGWLDINGRRLPEGLIVVAWQEYFSPAPAPKR